MGASGILRKTQFESKLVFSTNGEIECSGVEALFHTHTSTLVGSKMVVFGGLKRKTPLNSIFILDLNIFRWKKLNSVQGDVPSGRCKHSALLLNDLLLISGGKARNRYFSTLYTFDLATSTWKRLETWGERPGPRASHSMDYLENRDQIFQFGGKVERSCFNHIHALNISSLVWERLRPTGKKPSPRTNHGSCVVGRYLYIFGGYYGGSNATSFLSDMHILDSVLLVWTTPLLSSNPPRGRATMTMELVHNKIIVFGGYSAVDRAGNSAKIVFSDLHIFDPETDQWLGAIPGKSIGLKGRTGHSTVVCDNRLLLQGGFNRVEGRFSSLEEVFVELL